MLFWKKILNLGFRNSPPIFLKTIFYQLQHFFCTHGYLFESIFALLTFRDKGVRVLAGFFFKFEMWPALCKFPILFSTVKLKLEYNFSQFINRLKIQRLESWSQAVLPSFSQFTKRSKIGIFEYCSKFLIISLDCTSKYLLIH